MPFCLLSPMEGNATFRNLCDGSARRGRAKGRSALGCFSMVFQCARSCRPHKGLSEERYLPRVGGEARRECTLGTPSAALITFVPTTLVQFAFCQTVLHKWCRQHWAGHALLLPPGAPRYIERDVWCPLPGTPHAFFVSHSRPAIRTQTTSKAPRHRAAVPSSQGRGRRRSPESCDRER